MPYGMGYRAYQGDPFLGGLIKKGISFAARKVIGLTPIGAVAGAVGGAVYKKLKGQPKLPAMPGAGLPAMRSYSGTKAGPSKSRAPYPAGVVGPGMEMEGKRRRRTNFGNTKALARASRRVDGFVRVARRALRHTNYKLVSKSAGRAKRDLGPRHTHVR